MRLLIVEDEEPIAHYLHGLIQAELNVNHCKICLTLPDAIEYVNNHEVDLCFLDLNLNGLDGYTLLREFTAMSFHTIVVSAYHDKSLKAFEYGIFDFIPKPVEQSRLKKSIERFIERKHRNEMSMRYLSYRENNAIHLLEIKEVIYFKGAGSYTEAICDHKKALLNKSLLQLDQILPDRFLRVHKSYIVDINYIRSFGHATNGTYEITLLTGQRLPLSRNQYSVLQKIVNY